MKMLHFQPDDGHVADVVPFYNGSLVVEDLQIATTP